MMHEVAVAGEETTAYSVGHSIGQLLNLKRMIELNMTDHSSNPEGMRGLTPMFSKNEIIDVIDETVNRLSKVTYPYKV